MGDVLRELLPGYNLNNDRVRSVYSALTDDEIHKAEPWSRFREHAKRRNAIVHGGKRVSKEDAEASYDVVVQLTKHVAAVVQKALS